VFALVNLLCILLGPVAEGQVRHLNHFTRPERGDPGLTTAVHLAPCVLVNVTLQPGQTRIAETTQLQGGADTVLSVWRHRSLVAWNDDRDLSSAEACIFPSMPMDGSSCVSWTNSSGEARQYQLVMHGARAGHLGQGTARLSIDGSLVRVMRPHLLAPHETDLEVGCGLWNVPMGSQVMHATVAIPGGPDTSMLMILDGAGQPQAWDLSSGLGGMSRLGGVLGTSMAVISPGPRVLLAPPAITPRPGAGPVWPRLIRYYANDLAPDLDGDGLGPLLEGAIGTCHSSTTFAFCSSVLNRADTDGDGLSDGAEVFGANLQPLPRWGSDPRHKDIFVEVDWRGPGVGNNGQAENPLSGVGVAIAIADFAQSALNHGTAGDLQNPDGRAGVNIHIDLGVSPPAGSVDVRYGDWGGSNACVMQRRNHAWNEPLCMTQSRRGIFFYGYADPNSNGQASGAIPAFDFGVVRQSMDAGAVRKLAYNFTHELGHVIGLSHHGSDWYGGALQNNNPYYCSLMNYSMDDRPQDTPNCRTVFSRGQNRHLVVDASSVLETQSAWRSYFAVLPFRLTPPAGGSLGVDWDRDGYLGPLPVRAPVTAAAGSSDQAFVNEAVLIRFAADRHATIPENDVPVVPHPQGLVGSNSVRGRVTPSLVAGPGNRLTVFYVDIDGLIRYGTAPVGNTPSGCTLGAELFFDQRQTGCSRAMPETPPVRSLPRQEGQSPWAMTGQPINPLMPGTFPNLTQVDRIVPGMMPGEFARSIAATMWRGRMYVAWLSNSDEIYVTSSGQFSSDPAVQAWVNWTPRQVLAAPSATGERPQGTISLSVWNTNPLLSTWTGPDTLALTWGSFSGIAGTLRYRTLRTPGLPWDATLPMVEVLSDGSLGVMEAAGGVVMTPWPDETTVSSASDGVRTTCGVFLHPAPEFQEGLPFHLPHWMLSLPQQMKVRCLDPSDNRRVWRLASQASQDLESYRTSHIPGFVFRASRLAHGAIAYPWNDHGTFWLVYLPLESDSGRRVPTLVMSSRLTSEAGKRPWDPGHAWRFRAPQGELIHWWSNSWAHSVAGVSLVMARSWGTMKGAWFRGSGPGERRGIVVEPVADGTWAGLLCDGNDYVVMRRGICAGVRRTAADGSQAHPDQYCGGTRDALESLWFGAVPRATCLAP
jgi:hypothetical protein